MANSNNELILDDTFALLMLIISLFASCDPGSGNQTHLNPFASNFAK